MKNIEKGLLGVVAVAVITLAAHAFPVARNFSDITQTAQVASFFLSPSPSPLLSPFVSPSPIAPSNPTNPTQNPTNTFPPTDPALKIDEIQLANAELKSLGKDPKNISFVVPIAQERQELMKALAEKSAVKFLELTIDPKTREELIPQVRTYVEKKEITTGNLEVVHIDDFDNHENSKFEYNMFVAARKYAMYNPVELDSLQSGKAKVDGWTLDNVIVLSAGNSAIVPLANQEGSPAVGNQKLLALITEMGTETSPVTVAQVEDALFSPTGLFETYYRKQSYDKTWFTGKVYKIKLSRSAAREGCTSGIYINDTDLIAAIKAQGIDLHDYDRVLFIPPVGYCSAVGKTMYTVGDKNYLLSESWVSWDEFKSAISGGFNHTLLHEIGHSLGVMHANFLDCETQGVDCHHIEYGNFFDVMGQGWADFNALYKEQLNWLAPSDFQNITKAGTYTIGALEDRSGIRAAKIVNPYVGPLSVMYLERRAEIIAPTWVDDPITKNYFAQQRNGLLLNAPEEPSYLKVTAPELIDMSPKESGTSSPETYGNVNVGLLPGMKAYKDPALGLTLDSVALSDSVSGNHALSFHVDFEKPLCSSSDPQIIYNPKWVKTVQGGSFYFSVGFKNNDSSYCASASEFKLEIPELPVGISIHSDEFGQTTTSVTVSPGQSAYMGMTIDVSPTAPLPVQGSYVIPFTLKNVTSGKTITSYLQVEVLPALHLSLDKQIVQPGDTLKMTVNVGQFDYLNVDGLGVSNGNTLNLFHGPAPEGYSDKVITVTIPPMNEGLFGKYNILFSAYSAVSNTVPLIIGSDDTGVVITPPVSEILSKPTLELTYNAAKKESELTANVSLSVTAGNNKDIVLYKKADHVLFNNKDQASVPYSYFMRPITISADASNSVNTVVYPEGDGFLIPKGTSLKFNAQAELNPQIAPPGIYTAIFTTLSYAGPGGRSEISLPTNITNQVAIVGETAPYITEAETLQSSCGDVVVVDGVRFNPSYNVVSMIENAADGAWINFPGIISSNNGTSIKFVPSRAQNLKPGVYFVRINNTYKNDASGMSNLESIKITNKTGDAPCPSPSPSPTFSPTPSPSVVSVIETKGTISKIAPVSTAASAALYPGTSVVITGKNFPLTPTVHIGSMNVFGRTSDDRKNITFTLPDLSPGDYGVFVTGSGDAGLVQSDTSSITILMKPATSTVRNSSSSGSGNSTGTPSPAPSSSSSPNPSGSPHASLPHSELFAEVWQAWSELFR